MPAQAQRRGGTIARKMPPTAKAHTDAAYVKAKEAFETAAGRKREIKESMTLLVLSSERRKEEKLNELMAKMSSDDA